MLRYRHRHPNLACFSFKTCSTGNIITSQRKEGKREEERKVEGERQKMGRGRKWGRREEERGRKKGEIESQQIRKLKLIPNYLTLNPVAIWLALVEYSICLKK